MRNGGPRLPQFPILHDSSEVEGSIMAPKNDKWLPRGDPRTGEIPKQGSATSAGDAGS